MTWHFSSTSFVAGVVFGVLLAGAWFFGGASRLIPQPVPLAADTAPQTPESTALSVGNQSAGDTVFVESVGVPPPGVWIAVREVNGNNLGNVLGAARVNSPRTAVSVSLLRATEPGRSYAVELYRDDNDGVFDPSANSVYVDFDTGARIVAYFTTAP